MIFVVWGVSGCGKSTVGNMLARELDGKFYDADDFHPQSNIEKMRAGNPLNDEDRWPWLNKLADVLADADEAGETVVLACSALKQSYRDCLGARVGSVRFVHLQGDFDLIAKRLAAREHEFMNNNLLTSQFETLEYDASSIVADIDASPEDICRTVKQQVGLL